MEDTPPSATQPSTQAAGMPPKPEKHKRRGTTNTLVHTARVIHAMTDLAAGKVSGKREAAEKHGLGPTALNPSHVHSVLQSHHAPVLLSIDPLDVTGSVEGKRMSLRDALAGGMEAAIATIGTLRAKIGKLTKVERESLNQAKDWLRMCRENGLWKTPINAPNGGGLMPIAPREPQDHEVEGSAPWYLKDMRANSQPEGSTDYGGITVPDPVSPSNPA